MEDALCSSRWFRVGAFAGRRFRTGTFPARFRRGRLRAAAGIDLQAHPSGYAVAAQSIPPLQFRNADVELLSNGIERISPADAIVNQLAQHGLRVRRGRNNQFVAGVQWGAAVDAVGIGDGGGRHAVLSRDRAESLTLFDAMAPPAHPFLRRDGGNLGEETLGGALRQAQLEVRFLGRDHAQQLRIERPQRLHVHVNGFGHQPQVNRMAGLDPVGANWRLWVHLEAIPLRIFGHQSEGEDDRNVIAGFPRQRIALIKFPEVGVAGVLDGMFHVGRPGVVGGHHQVPIPELLVEVAQVPRRRACGLFGILSLVHPPTALQPVFAPAIRHELPDAARAGSRERQGLESALCLCQVD